VFILSLLSRFKFCSRALRLLHPAGPPAKLKDAGAGLLQPKDTAPISSFNKFILSRLSVAFAGGGAAGYHDRWWRGGGLGGPGGRGARCAPRLGNTQLPRPLCSTGMHVAGDSPPPPPPPPRRRRPRCCRRHAVVANSMATLSGATNLHLKVVPERPPS
jgi:hypothetical protein